MSKVVALDYGQKRVGVAVSDGTLTLAQPRPFIKAEPFKQFLYELKTLLKAEEITLILIGLPRNMDGSYGPSADKAREFALHIGQAVTVPIELVDERLSTVQASRMLQEGGHDTRAQKGKIDSASAAVLLQTYLDKLAMQQGL